MVAETRQLLRQQGFKTDLSDFNFSTSPEIRAREAIIMATFPNSPPAPLPPEPLDLLTPVSTRSAIVVWQQSTPWHQNPSRPNYTDDLTWNDLSNALNRLQPQIDAACHAVLAGPIAFNLNVGAGGTMRLPHLEVLRNLSRLLGSRMVLDIRDGGQEAAWTNLLAATRLITAWQPEPAEISCIARFADTKLAFNATWQALQTNNWSDDQLARLQTEWESTDFLTNLPETAAFKRASDVADLENPRVESDERPPFGIFIILAIRAPQEIFEGLSEQSRQNEQQNEYRSHGMYEDEKGLMLFYRDREIELRNAVQAPTWQQMRQLPGVVNTSFYQSRYRTAETYLFRMNEGSLSSRMRGTDILLSRAAEAEAERRILITAVALERYRLKHKAYPQSLSALAPEFLKTVPVDFMDGQPLRYHLSNDGHFLLYSVGQDCVDNGGKMPVRMGEEGFVRPIRPGMPQPDTDIVWPLPAGSAAMKEQQQTEAKAKEASQKRYLTEISNREWSQSLMRQTRVQKILSADWSAVNSKPTFEGQSVEKYIGNRDISGTNQLSLDAMLTPRQIFTGKEPEDITIEFPIKYDVLTTNKNNLLRVVVDADPGEDFPMDSGGDIYDSERATNGDCLIIWHTIYDPPGLHAVQSYLVLDDREGRLYLWGRPVTITTSNLCQFSLDCVNYDPEVGARFHARLPESNGLYSIECVTTNGAHLKTLSGSTTNGEFNLVWNLADDSGNRLTGETFNTIVHITLTDSGRSQTMRGP